MIRVFGHWLHSRALISVAIDLAFVVAVVATAVMWIRSGLGIDLFATLAFTAVLATVMVVINTWLGLYQANQHRNIYQNIARALLTLYISVPIAYVLFAALPFAQVDRGFFELTLMTAMYGMLANRVRAIYTEPAQMLVHRVMVFGVGERALSVCQALQSADPTIVIVGCYRGKADEIPAVPSELILPADRSLLDSAKALNADQIVVALTEQRGGALPLRELLDCKLSGIAVLDLASYFEQLLGQIRLDAVRAGWLVFGEGFDQGHLRNISKRLFDIFFSVILLILTLPLVVIAAILIVLESGFPIFYSQERVGKNGRVFVIRKLRSMRTDAEIDGKPRWASVGDARVTRVGRLLRKMRIDELPQIFSVVTGDMSLVGPRPERPFFVNQLTQEIPFYGVRHSIKPGVTGWAQVRYHYGASMADASAKLQYDLYYVKNHSLFLDILILFDTVGVVLAAEGA